ncbi:MAG: metallophosphoesterase [bacterium]
MNTFTRRSFVKTLAAGTAALAMPTGCAVFPKNGAGGPKPSFSGKGADFSFVHLTDMHVCRRRKGYLGYRACIESVRAIRPKVDFALMGGDLAFDGNYNEKDEFADQIQLYKSISDDLGMPYYHCMGNHDTLGLSGRRKVPVDDPDMGKKMIMDRLGWDKSYYSFDRNGWHFVVLDSIYEIQATHGPSYEARIGKEQLEWLRYDLGAACGKPTVAVIHIAAFCNLGTINGDPEAKAIMPGMVVADSKDLREILERHKVKALLQGHSHMKEDYYYDGVWYLTSHAVSSCWWGGNWMGFKTGYRVLHCKGDELAWEFCDYPWEHQLEPVDTLERKRIAEREAFEAEQERLLEEERAGRMVPVG